MQKKILAIFLALAMIFVMAPMALTAAPIPVDIIHALHGAAPGVIVTAETPDYTPTTYGDGDTASLADLHPGDILEADVDFDITDEACFILYEDLTHCYQYVEGVTYTGSQLIAALGEGLGSAMVVDNYYQDDDLIRLVPVFTPNSDNYGVFVYDENSNGGEFVPITDDNLDVFDDGTVVYDPDDNILTLSGAEFTAPPLCHHELAARADRRTGRR